MAFSTARHDNRADDPDESRVLKSTVRFVGQRVAAVVADSVAIAEKACRAIAVEHQELPAAFDPEVAHTPGAEASISVATAPTRCVLAPLSSATAPPRCTPRSSPPS